MTGSPAPQARPRGTAVIRLAGPGDREKIAAFIMSLPPETQYERFNAYPSAQSLPYLCGGKGDMVLVAEAGGVIVGHASVAPAGGSAGEIAVVVDDAWQRRGIATRLIEAAAERAAERGMDTLIAFVKTGRPHLISMLSRLGGDMQLSREDRRTWRAEIRLPTVAQEQPAAAGAP